MDKVSWLGDYLSVKIYLFTYKICISYQRLNMYVPIVAFFFILYFSFWWKMCFHTVVFNGLIRAWFSPTGFQLNLVKIVTLCRFFVDTEKIHRIHPCRDCNYDTFASQLPNSYLGHPSIWCNTSITGIDSLLSIGVSRTC